MNNFKLTVLKNAEPIAENSLLLIKGGIMPLGICETNNCTENNATCGKNTCTVNHGICKDNTCLENNNLETPCHTDKK